LPILSAISAMSSALTPGAYIAGVGVRSGTSLPSGGAYITLRSSPVPICAPFQISEVGSREGSSEGKNRGTKAGRARGPRVESSQPTFDRRQMGVAKDHFRRAHLLFLRQRDSHISHQALGHLLQFLGLEARGRDRFVFRRIPRLTALGRPILDLQRRPV
jgi:hypothetical protein